MKKTPFVPAIALVIFLAYLIVGCGGGALTSNHHSATTGSTTTTTTGGATTSGAGAGITVSAAAGGTVSSANGAVLVLIPAKALPGNTKISVNPVADTTTLPAVPQNTTIVAGTAYEFGPEAQFFNSAPTLRIAYTPANLPSLISERDLQIYSVVNGSWQPVLNVTDDPVNHIISAPIYHFSVYAVVSLLSYSGVPKYDLIDVGVLSGDNSSTPTGISANGYVSGYSTSTSGLIHAFSWISGLTLNLGSRAGDIGAVANCINSAGIAGGKSIQNPLFSYPVLFSGGGATQVLTASGQTTGAVTALNDNGSYIVGNAIVKLSTLTSFSGFSPGTTAAALNNSDAVAGYDSSQHAALWRSGVVTDLGLLKGYDSSTAVAVGDNGDVVGNVFDAANDIPPAGFIYTAGKMTLLPVLSGDDIMLPSGVNGGKVVGTSSLDFNASRGVIYAGGALTDLNTLIPTNTGWTITQALGINANGQIIALGQSATATHALVLTPRPATSIVFAPSKAKRRK